MEFEVALYIDMALFALYTALLVAFSVSEAMSHRNRKSMQAKKAA